MPKTKSPSAAPSWRLPWTQYGIRILSIHLDIRLKVAGFVVGDYETMPSVPPDGEWGMSIVPRSITIMEYLCYTLRFPLSCLVLSGINHKRTGSSSRSSVNRRISTLLLSFICIILCSSMAFDDISLHISCCCNILS